MTAAGKHSPAYLQHSGTEGDIDSCVSWQGLIDVEKEVAKLQVKKTELSRQLEKLQERVSGADYRNKVPTAVQQQDADKVSCSS